MGATMGAAEKRLRARSRVCRGDVSQTVVDIEKELKINLKEERNEESDYEIKQVRIGERVEVE